MIPFKCLSRADLIVRDETVEELRRAGCRTVWIGAESGSQKILDAMDKGITVEQIEEAAGSLRSAGIRVGFFLQFGYPGEKEREVEATLEMVRRAAPDEIGISVSYPLPGTKFYERVVLEMGEKKNWSESADLAMMFRGYYGTEFYRVLARWVHRDHRLGQARRAFTQLIGGRLPSRDGLRRIALAPYYLAARTLDSLELSRLKKETYTPSTPHVIELPVVEEC
jgi:anaerobic magnesium-protoporphyrin IX monomethyl ester cyclase